MANSAHRLGNNFGLGGIKTSFLRLGDAGSAQSTTDSFVLSGTGVPSGAYNLATGATAIYFREDAATTATWAYVTVNGGTNWTVLDPAALSTADLNGTELILDADADTSITADTDDQIDIKISGADDFQMTANTFSVLTGSNLVLADSCAVKFGTGLDDVISHDGTNTLWAHITGDLTFDNQLVTGSTIMLLGTDTTAVDFQVQNNSAFALLTVTPTSATGGTTTAYGLISKSATASAITTTRTLTAADSGGVFSVAKTSAYAITLPTPAQGLDFTFMVLDTGANAVTISNGSAHLFGNINEAGTVPIAMTGTTLSLAASGSVGDWVRIQGIDATHYLVTGTSIAASKITIA